jgi:hypothetical protein
VRKALKYTARFLRDDTAESLNRLLVLLIVANGLAMGWVTLVIESVNATDALMIAGGVCGIAAGWKGWQKSQELKSKKELQKHETLGKQ